MEEELQKKMQRLMYSLTKDAARSSYAEYLEELNISDEEYMKIKKVWLDKLGIKPYV